MAPILPGATLGILGGGQLGRMMAMAARAMGYRVHALDPDPDCPARAVTDLCLTAEFDDPAAAAELARSCDVVTIEIERVSIASMEAAATTTPVRPAPSVLRVVQHRLGQKQWLASRGFPVGPYLGAHSADELAAAIASLGGDCFVKASVGGYDGRGQTRVRDAREAGAAWRAAGESACLVERALDLERELSVLVARSPSGEVVVFPPAVNHHERHVLAWSVIPGPIEAHVATRAREIASGIAISLDVEGLLAVELFLLRDGALLVNELAPRPHNTFHHTDMACITSQFEEAVRAVCDLPLGAPDVLRPVALANLFGDLWLGDAPPRFDLVLRMPGVRLFLYGKRPRPGRKMGHLCAMSETPSAAVALVNAARAELMQPRGTAGAARPDLLDVRAD